MFRSNGEVIHEKNETHRLIFNKCTFTSVANSSESRSGLGKDLSNPYKLWYALFFTNNFLATVSIACL